MADRGNDAHLAAEQLRRLHLALVPDQVAGRHADRARVLGPVPVDAAMHVLFEYRELSMCAL